MSDIVLASRDGGALVLTINRPDDLNRIDGATMRRINALLDEADRDASVRVIVVTGEGEYFCAGGRIDGHPGGTVREQLAFAQAFCSLQERMGRTNAPIVAAVSGHCTAGGMSLLAACDLAIAADDVEFAYPEINFGLFPMLAMAVAHSQMPAKKFFDICYSGRRFSAAEAVSLGLVNRAVPRAALSQAVAASVEMLTAKSSVALALGRKAYYAMSAMTPAARLDYAQVMLTTMLNGGAEGAIPRSK
jgi:enoyl-CoA hydratase/carnithine racemase